MLATALFTDICGGSTERAEELGDRRWRELLGSILRVETLSGGATEVGFQRGDAILLAGPASPGIAYK